VNAETTHYLWNGDEVIKEYTGTGGQKSAYFLGAGREGIKTDTGWKGISPTPSTPRFF